jgi:hypothetical protein
MADEDYDPRKPPETPHAWKALNDGAEKGAKSWLIVAPIYIVVTNWKVFGVALFITGVVIRFARPDLWEMLMQTPGVGK